MPLASLAIGVSIEVVGTTAAVLALAALMGLVAVCAGFSRAVRHAPPPPPDEGHD